LAEEFPALRIVYGYSPPFRELTLSEEENMLRELTDSGARLVFFGIGCPKQEQWMGRYKGRIDAAMIAVGAAFDTIGGLVQPSPAFIHRVGLEWLFRFVREPRRLYRRYLVSAPRFVWLMFTDWTRSAFHRGASAEN
jgi:N-acetylglucosaminyldiphosphoundecaprenol N-acetyl-beta-D-mannosaminyltransferase